jgi:hypothetical protein
MHYTPHIDFAFDSVEYIMRDVKHGWLLRYIHANGASMFFIVVYCHIGRGLYYGSYMFPRKTLWCSGVVIFLLMMATAFTGVRVKCVVEFLFLISYVSYPKYIDWYHRNNLILESLLRKWLVTLRVQIINSLGFKRITSGGVKEFTQVSKVSIKRSKTLMGVVSKLSRVSTFSRTNSLISKRFWVYLIAKNYIKLVQSKYFTTLIYTFNSIKNLWVTVEGEIGKKTLLSKSTCLNNKLALKIQNFSTNIPQTSALVPVQTNKSEHSSFTSSLAYDKACQASLKTILFIERMNRIEDNRSFLYKIAFSSDSLLVAYDQIKSKSGNLTPGDGEEMLKRTNLNWFKSVSHKLLKGLFVYPRMRRVFIFKKAGSVDTRPLTITSPRIKIIERSILNVLEPVFEGKFN